MGSKVERRSSLLVRVLSVLVAASLPSVAPCGVILECAGFPPLLVIAPFSPFEDVKAPHLRLLFASSLISRLLLQLLVCLFALLY